MVLEAAAAAGAASLSAGVTLFDYNRENFRYDRKMRQETEYQIMEFRIKQAELWREDIRDIIGLTSVKMDTYLIVNAVQLGFCVMAFCEGRLAAGTPTWLIGCHTLSLAGAFMFLLMSVWLSMQAMVAAKSYEVRLMTQMVRLPIPSWTQLEGARTYSSAFEKVETKQMFRVPFAMGSQEDVLQRGRPARRTPFFGASASSSDAALIGPDEASDTASNSDFEPLAAAVARGPVEAADVWGLERRGDAIYELDGSIRGDPRSMQHLRLLSQVTQYWQAYDAFARVAMSVGTNQLITALAYYVLAYVLISNHEVIAAWLVVMLFMMIAGTLIRLDMSLTSGEYHASVFLVVAGPCLTAVAAQQWTQHSRSGRWSVCLLTPIIYLVHALWLLLLLYVSKVREQKSGALLPTGFRSVMYIDVFGWIRRQQERRASYARAPSAPQSRAGPGPAAGPGVQSVSYDEKGRPIPLRPEELPGAAPAGYPAVAFQADDFDPTTFMPREAGDGTSEPIGRLSKAMRPGTAPWYIFCTATILLVTLWCLSGAVVLLRSMGMAQGLQVAPLLREPEGEHVLEEEDQQILISSPFATLEEGELISTAWPTLRVRPQGLACGDFAGASYFASSSDFGLYAGKLSPSDYDGARSLDFAQVPECSGIDGEALEDIALSCRPWFGGAPSATAGCRVLALHGQGRRLSSCAMPHFKEARPQEDEPAESQVADSWLRDEDGPPEEVTSIALAVGSGCRGRSGGPCAFVETSGRRIVEVALRKQIDEGSGEARPGWFPTRVLTEQQDEHARQKGGVLHLVADRYLGVLRADSQQLDALDVHDGSLLGSWQLPEGHRWEAMCSAAGSLFLLAAGPSPELWRFPLPAPLVKTSEGAPQATQTAGPGAPRASASSSTVVGVSKPAAPVADIGLEEVKASSAPLATEPLTATPARTVEASLETPVVSLLAARARSIVETGQTQHHKSHGGHGGHSNSRFMSTRRPSGVSGVSGASGAPKERAVGDVRPVLVSA